MAETAAAPAHVVDARPDPSRAVHIAIVRFTSLGDVIHALPMAAAIRRHLPNARVTWLVEEREQVLLRDNPVVDDVVVVPLRRWRASLGSVSGLRQSAGEWRDVSRRLRAAGIDVAIDVQGWAHKTSPFTWLTRAPLRIGFDRAHARDPFSTLVTNRHVTPPADARHIVDQNLALLTPLGIGPGDLETATFPLPAYLDSESRAQDWLRQHEIGASHRLVVLLPSTRGAAKHWPVEAYQKLGRRLISADDVRLLILGGPGEEELLARVRQPLPPDRAYAWAPAPIPDLVAILRRAHIVIGNDTGPLHVAAASGVPALGLFGPTRGERNGPYGAHGAYLQSPTGRMEDLRIDDVFNAVKRLSPSHSQP